MRLCGRRRGCGFRWRADRVDGAGFGLEDGAVFVADGLAFLGELSDILLAVAENGDEATGSGEKAIDCPGGEDGAFAELPSPVQAEDSGRVVFENRNLIGAKFHPTAWAGNGWEGKDLCKCAPKLLFGYRLVRQ